MTRKVTRLSALPEGVASPYVVPPGGTLWAYRVDWLWLTVVSEEIANVIGTGPDTEAAHAQEAWDEFLNIIGVRDIELKLTKLEMMLRHLQAYDPGMALAASEQLKDVLTRIAHMRDVDAAGEDRVATMKFQ